MVDSKRGSNLTKVDYHVHGLDLYRQNARELMYRSQGIERYIIGLFGPDLIGSWALALDVNRPFYNTVNRVAFLEDGSKIVRTRTPATIKGINRKIRWTAASITEGYTVNPEGGVFDYIYTGPTRSELQGTVDRGAQPPVFGLIRDTTRRTRPKDKDQGEFELFIPKLLSHSQDTAWKTVDYLATNDIGSGQRIKRLSYTRNVVSGPEIRVLNSEVQLYLTGCRTRAAAAMSKHVLSMMNRVHPNRRTYDLIYQITELRDLRQTLSSTLQIWIAFERTVGTQVFRSLQRSAKHWRNPDIMRSYSSELGHLTGFNVDEAARIDINASKAFLSFKFGWDSMVRAVQDFMPSPQRVARRINYLVTRIGKDTSYRTKKTWIDNDPTSPAVSIGFHHDEEILDNTIVRRSGRRQMELRLMANFQLNFPHLDVPRLRKQLFLRHLGAEPSPQDLYNLIPWTWLADWFTGAGDYVQLLDTVSDDRFTVNYSFITYTEYTEVTASLRGKLSTSWTRRHNDVVNTYETVQPFIHEGKFKLKYTLRRSVPRVSNKVNTYWDPGLDANKTAIVGALLGSRSGFRSRRGV